MIKFLYTLTLLLLVKVGFTQSKKEEPVSNSIQRGLIIIDAQKWFIPSHPESLYKKWNIRDYDRGSKELINSMDSVLIWANNNKLPVFITYEGLDTGAYDLPDQLKKHLDSASTKHFVKQFYGALKHKEFNEMIQNSKIKDWVIIGAETDVCVYQTARELLRRNMNVSLVKNAIYSGKNSTSISYQNLVKFGADTISITDLKHNNFNQNRKHQIDPDIKFENLIITIIKNNPNFSDTTSGNYIRLNYLKKYAKITGLEVEEINDINLIKKNSKTRVFPGNVTKAIKFNYQYIVLTDCLTSKERFNNNETQIKTLKILFYELMETAEFYTKTPKELSGWLSNLQEALISRELNYVEYSQNIK